MDFRSADFSVRLEGLQALRDLLVERLAVGEPKDTAALARQLRDVLKEIDEIERLVPKESLSDELASRRAGRSKGGSAATRGGRVQRA